MTDHAKNGALRHTEFDVVADLRKEIDQDITGLDRRMGIVESVLTTRVDGIDLTLKHILDAVKANASEMSDIRRLLMGVLETKPRAPRRKK